MTYEHISGLFVFWKYAKTWVIAFGVVAVVLLLTRRLKSTLLARWKRHSEKSANKLDDILVTLTGRVGIPLLYILAFYIGAQYLQTSDKVQSVLNGALLVVITWSVLRLITSLIGISFKWYMRDRPGGGNEKQGRGILMIVNVMLWVVGFVFHIDLFSYQVIFFDKPFEIGDFIIVDDKMGSIEYIGIKTTRIRTLSGEQLICSNSALTSFWVHNYKRMERRRIVFSFGVGE